MELRLCRVHHARMHQLRFLGNPCHRGFNHRPDALAGSLRAAAQALAQRLINGLCKIGIDHFDIAMEGLLAVQQAFVQLLAHALHLRHHGLHLVDHRRQGLRLKLQRLVRFLALVRE
jgi:hypothetical protein